MKRASKCDYVKRGGEASCTRPATHRSKNMLFQACTPHARAVDKWWARRVMERIK